MLVVGVSGVTNGGKTTLAKTLLKILPRSHLLCQDTYFLPQDDSRHTLVPELNHFNWEIMSSLNMEQMWKDIELILENKCCTDRYCLNSSFHLRKDGVNKEDDLCKLICDHDHLNNVDVLIIEGFLVLNYEPIVNICDLKYHVTLTKEECWRRRQSRAYDPPDVPGYFEMIVWPEYEKHKEEMLKTVHDVKVIDGTQDINSILVDILSDIVNRTKNGD